MSIFDRLIRRHPEPEAFDDDAVIEACLARLERKAKIAKTERLLRSSDERIAATKHALAIPPDEPLPASVDWASVRRAGR